MWDEVLEANTRAWAASKASTQGDVLPVEEWDWHAYDWLHYAYLQQGRHAAAQALADSAREWWTPERLVEQDEWGQQRFGHYARILAVRQALETDDWSAEMGDLRTASGGAELLFAARAAAAHGDRATIDALLARARAVADSVEAESPREAGVRRVTVMQLRAISAQAAGRGEEAITLLRAAADSAEAQPDLHLREGPARANAGNPRLLLGEFLMAAGRPAEALAAYDRALELSPGRSLALLGRARALKALGRAEEARRAYARLLESWRHADAALPQLAEARAGAGG
jgi:tetratricopeptide (TPR) repeat protein